MQGSIWFLRVRSSFLFGKRKLFSGFPTGHASNPPVQFQDLNFRYRNLRTTDTMKAANNESADQTVRLSACYNKQDCSCCA